MSEPSSREALRPRTEREILAAIESFAAGKTTPTFVDLLALHRETASRLGAFLGLEFKDSMHTALEQIECMMWKLLPAS